MRNAGSNIAWLQGKHEWEGIKTIAMVTRQREIDGKVFTEKAVFISSIENDSVKIVHALPKHCGVENGLHWCLDISFREDYCRVRKDHALESFAILRHIAINLHKQKNPLKAGIQAARLKAAWDNNNLLKS